LHNISKMSFMASKQIKLILLRAYLNCLQYSSQVEDKRYGTT
jgi:hypothetical protein